MCTDAVDIRVRYAETDQMGVVYSANFFVYFEVARTEYLRKLGTVYSDLERVGVYLMVVEAHCKHTGPARYDDVLTVVTCVERLRPTRVDFRHVVRRKADDAAVAEGRVVLACVGEDGRPMRLPPQIRDVVSVVPSDGG